MLGFEPHSFQVHQHMPSGITPTTLKVHDGALTCVAQWVGCRPVNQKVTCSIPSQDTCLGCGPGPQSRACECFSPSFSPSLPLSLKINKIFLKKKYTMALAGMVQWIEHQPANQRVASSIPRQGTCLCCRAHERQPHIDVSLPVFLPPFPSV